MTVKGMTREEKISLLKAIEERERRKLLARPKYVPNEGQDPVHRSKAKNRYVFSGNGAGKTALLANELHWAFKGYNPITNTHTRLPAKIIVVVDTSRKIDEVIVPELKKWFVVPEDHCQRLGKPYTARIKDDMGSVIDFYSTDADPASFEGVESTDVFIDEPVPKPLFTAVKRSLRIKGAPCRLLFCGTAVSQAWLRKEIYEPWAKGELEDTECFKTHTSVNKANLAQGYIDDFERLLSDAEKQVRLEGGFFDSDTVALGHLWKRDIHVINRRGLSWDPNWPCVIGIDPHPVKKHVAVLIGADDNDELVALEELALKCTASQFAARLKPWVDQYRVIEIVCDSLGSMDTTSAEGFMPFIEALNKAGIPTRATRYEDKSHEALIDRLQTGLLIPENPDNFGRKIPKLRVASNCTGLISDIESCTWQKNRNTGEMIPKLDTSSKDFLSAYGYGLSCNLSRDKTRKMKPHYPNRPLVRGITPRALRYARSKVRATED